MVRILWRCKLGVIELLPSMADAAIGSILLLSGLAKMWDRRSRTNVVLGFDILPKAMAPGFATLLPFAEAIVGTALLSRIMKDSELNAWSGFAAMFLFAMFGIAIAINLVRGRTEISCGCFGSTGRKISWGLVGRAGICLGVSVITLPGVQRTGAAETTVRDRVNAALVGAAVVVAVWLGRFIIDRILVPLEPQS
jgi:hypothetical protein